MMKLRRLIIFAVLFLAAFGAGGSWAHAARFITNDRVDLTKTIHDDVYVAAGDITIDADIDGDLIVAGGTVVANGDINGDLFVGSGNVIINGNINHTARVTGGQITVNSYIGRDLLVAGGTIKLSKGTMVTGDVVAAGGDFISFAEIKDDLLGGFGSATIDGPIGGDVKIAADKLTVANKADIRGDLKYTSSSKAIISPNAKISGETTRRIPPKPRSNVMGQVLGWLWALVSMLVVGIVLAWLFPKSLKNVEATLRKQTWQSLGLGFAALFLLPMAILIVMFTIIGIPLALIILVLYIIAIYLSQIYAATAVGSWIIGKERWVGLSVILGVTLLSIVKVVPLIGGLVSFSAILFGLGAMVLSAWRYHWGKTDEQADT